MQEDGHLEATILLCSLQDTENDSTGKTCRSHTFVQLPVTISKVHNRTDV